MNMKKSIAGVMAGAMAVSAMATTASAFTGADQEQIVLSYDLNHYDTQLADRTFTVTYTFVDRTEGYVVNGLTDDNTTVYGKIGAVLDGPDIYMLSGLKIQGTSLPQYDDNGTTHTSTDSWSFSVEKENDNAYGSAVNAAVKLDKFYLDENNNIYAYEVPFTVTDQTKGKVGLGGFKIYGAETTKNVEFNNKADALAAAKKESVYTLVEEYKAETTTDTWTDAAGNTYAASLVTVDPADKTKGTVVTTPAGKDYTVTYDSGDITAVYTGGDWVLAVGTGSEMRYIKNPVSPAITEADLTTDFDDCVAGARFGTKPEAVAAIANADKAAVPSTTVKTITADDFEIVDIGATSYFKFGGKFVKGTTAQTDVAYVDLTAFITALNAVANSDTKTFDEIVADAGVAALLTTDVTEACWASDAPTADAALDEAVANKAITCKYKVDTTTPAQYFSVTVNYAGAAAKTVDVTKKSVGNKDGIYYLAKPVAGGVDAQGNVVYIAGERKTEVTAKNEGYGFKNFTVTLTYTMKGQWAGIKTWAANTKDGYINTVIDATTDAKTSLSDWAQGTFAYPLRSNWDLPGNVIKRLTANSYTYPQAVLNDVVANNENVAFTFTTCQKFVDTRDYIVPTTYYTDENGKLLCFRMTTPAGGSYIRKPSEVKYFVGNDGKYYVENEFYGVAYDAKPGTDFNGKGNWYNPYFTQDLYQNWTWTYLDGTDVHASTTNNGYHPFGPNGTQASIDVFGSYSAGWNKNLLAAGLVVNSAWTMQLSQTTAFSWGDQSITFLWDDITADKNVTNAANFITSLQLYTPVEWFWDRLDVSVGAAISEDIVPGAGLEEDADEEVVEEEVVEEEVIEEDFVEEEPVEEEPEEDFEEDFEEDWVEEEPVEEDFVEEEPVEEEVVEEEPVEEEAAEEEEKEEESPKTGNSPIALAVIPVALAAAAVIAKKRS